MKYIIGILTALIASTIFAGSPVYTGHRILPESSQIHWTKIESSLPVYDSVTGVLDLKADVYIDDAHTIMDDNGWIGYTVKWVFQTDVQSNVQDASDNNRPLIANHRETYSTIEVDCLNGVGRGKNNYVITPHHFTYVFNEDWVRPAYNSAGDTIVTDITNRLCVK